VIWKPSPNSVDSASSCVAYSVVHQKTLSPHVLFPENDDSCVEKGISPLKVKIHPFGSTEIIMGTR
jgi:hypothetical protein